MNDVKVKDFNSVGNLMVELQGISFTVDCINKPYILFWVNQDQADRLAFGINAALQDYEKRTLKATEELRDLEQDEKDNEPE